MTLQKRSRFVVCSVAFLLPTMAWTATPPPSLQVLVEAEPSRRIAVSFAEEKREGAMRAAALGYGARAGLARRGWEIARMLERRGGQLSAIYRFRDLLLEKRGFSVVPPVAAETVRAFRLGRHGMKAATARRVVRIVAAERLVSAPPDWRDYLMRSWAPVEAPVSVLFPRDRRERRRWELWIAEGWRKGFALADDVFASDLDRLSRDKAAWKAVHPAVVRLARELGDHFVPGRAGYADPLPDMTAELDAVGAARTYRAVLEEHVKRAGTAAQHAFEEAIREDAENINWLAAASFVNTVSKSAGRVQAASRNVPEASLPSPDLEKWSDQAASAVKAVMRGLSQARGYEAVPFAMATGIAGALAPSVGRGGTVLDRVTDFIDPKSVIMADSGNPLLDLTATGYGLMNTGILAMTLLAGVSVGSNFLGVVESLDAFQAGWEVMDGLVTPAIGMMIIGGAVLAYVLPAIPFIRFLFGILAWLLAVVEAMLAVTVFCAAHVQRAEGNWFVLPETRAGWLFLPGLVLRPVLMLFGLVIGYFVFIAVMEIFNEIWVPRMLDANASSGLDLIDFVAMLALYVMVAYGLLNACFKLIDVLPSAVLTWIGGAGGGDSGSEGVMGVATGGFGRAGALGGNRGFGPRGGGAGAAGGGAQSRGS